MQAAVTMQVVPNIRIVNGSPRIVETAQDTYGDRRNEFDLLKDSDVMYHIVGTYDTFKCCDCNSVLSGYKRGDPGLTKHVRIGEGRCRYVKAKFRGREKELLLLRGRLRFQSGRLAFPEYLLHSDSAGYVEVEGSKHCIVCTCPASEHHQGDACSDMRSLATTGISALKLDVPIDNIRLFTKQRPATSASHLVNVPHWDQPKQLFYLRLAPSQDSADQDFSVLGHPANMCYVQNTVDAHSCSQCCVLLQDFVRGDTLLGEHVYHSKGECPYIKNSFRDFPDQLMKMMAVERKRKGFIAFPQFIINSTYGTVTVGGMRLCVICGSIALHNHYPLENGHSEHCEDMRRSLCKELKSTVFL